MLTAVNKKTLRSVLQQDDANSGFNPYLPQDDANSGFNPYLPQDINDCIDGVLPRVCSDTKVMSLTKIRDMVLCLAEDASSSQTNILPIDATGIAMALQIKMSCKDEQNLRDVIRYNVLWFNYKYKGGQIAWPTVYPTDLPHLKTTCRLAVLALMWHKAPSLIEKDLSKVIETNFRDSTYDTDKNLELALSILEEEASNEILITNNIN